MMTDFFFKLRKASIPVSLTEFLTLLEALSQHVTAHSVEEFYYLARATLVKDERHYDRFDQVFGSHFKGLATRFDEIAGATVPLEWLHRLAELTLSDEDKQLIEAMGGWEKLMETFAQRMAEQEERHQGGNKWIGTAGTSPFGAYGYNPEGIRMGQDASRHRRAVKVWDRREFRNLDDTVELGVRNVKVALRRLRRFAREGAAQELDLDDTIRSTARNAGWLDLKMVPERHNAVKVLLFLDAGGSMDDHVQACEELFSAARGEFKHLEYFYFHNMVYEGLWKDNRRRYTEKTDTLTVLRTFGQDYKLILVGDATMSPYEVTYPGGSVEHFNPEAGDVWMTRLLSAWPSAIWLNPQPQNRWSQVPSIQMVRQLMDERMFPLTLEGLEQGIRTLQRAR